MALWRRLFAHPDFERHKSLYNDQFPIEVHFACADWIEEQIKLEQFIDFQNDQLAEQRAGNFMRSLIERLEQEKVTYIQPEQMSMKYRIEGAIRTYSEQLPFNALAIYRQIRDVIMYLENFLDGSNGSDQFRSIIDKESMEINEKLGMLHNQVLAIKEKQNRYNLELENFQTLEYTEQSNIANVYELDGSINRSTEEYLANKQLIMYIIETVAGDLTRNIGVVISEITEVQNIVIYKRLAGWQREQALAGNGAPLSVNTLDEIQIWFEKLAELIWITRNVIDAIRKQSQMSKMNMDTYYETYFTAINQKLELLIVSGFIVEKQPPQVMKINSRFAATVRMLTTNVGMQLNNATVIVSIISESQAQLQQQNKHSKALDETSGEILNFRGNLEMQQSSRHLSCNLRNMQLKRISRADKKGTESVKDEKFALLFKSSFQSADLHINVWSISLPVVVTVHGNQEPQSWATVTWDNAFSEISRTPFSVVDRVPWSHMAQMLNTKFNRQTGRGLTNENLFYLCEKAFRTPINFNPDERTITWSQFCKEQLPERNFTFWEWFFATMKLTRDQLRDPWRDGLINGFISKRHAEEKLTKCPPGTFLLRFSDSEIGGITIAWSEVVDGIMQVTMIEPFTNKHFAARSLADRINDLPQCVNLYPNIPKEQAFGAYFTPTPEPINPKNGYKRYKLKVVVGNENGVSSHPNTPQRYSPEHDNDSQLLGSFDQDDNGMVFQ